jgi:hypothetical protein
MFKRLLLLSAITVHSLSWSGMETNNHVACKAIKFLSNLTSLFESKAFSVSSSAAELNKAFSKSSRVYPQLGVPTSPSTVKIGGYAIGEIAQGGIVIWVTEDKQHGLVVSIVNLAPEEYILPWGPESNTTEAAYNDPLPKVYTKPIPKDNYSGYQNQQKIEGIPDWESSYLAFKACADYSIKINGRTYDDWFLPSLTELQQIYAQRAIVNEKVVTIPGGQALFTNETDPAGSFYWSSLEDVDNSDKAWFLYFFNGDQYSNDKEIRYAVRCVRAF